MPTLAEERIAHVFGMLGAVGQLQFNDDSFSSLCHISTAIIRKLEWERIGYAFIIAGLCCEIERQVDLWGEENDRADRWKELHDSHCDGGVSCSSHLRGEP